MVQISEPASSPHSSPVMPAACSSGGCGGTTDDVRSPLPVFGKVSVDGVDIPAAAIAQEMQHHPSPDGEVAWQQAARALVVRELLLREAGRLNICAKPEADDNGAVETDADASIRALLEQSLVKVAVTEDECRRYYGGRVEFFRTPDLFEASHILLEPEGDDDAAWAAALAQAQTIASEVGQDPARFAEAAGVYSRCPTASQGGSLGQIRRGELVVALQRILDLMTAGGMHPEPVRSRFGWHLLWLHRRMDGHTLPFELVRDKIGEMLEARSWSAQATRYVATLARAAVVEGVLLEPGISDQRPRTTEQI